MDEVLVKNYLFAVAITGWTIAAVGLLASLISCAPASNNTEYGTTTSSDIATLTKDCACPYTPGSAPALAGCAPATATQLQADPTITSYFTGNGCTGPVVR